MKANTKIITSAAMVAAGIVAGRFVSKAIGGGTVGAVAQIAAGAFVPSVLGRKQMALGVGLAASGVIDAVKTFAPGVASQVGLGYLPAPGSTAVHSVAGVYGTPVTRTEPINIQVD